MFNITKSNAPSDRHAKPTKAALVSADAPRPQFREYVRQLSSSQIEEQWRAHKTGFVAIASAPGHGLEATQLYTIWLLSWADRFAAATAKGRAILARALPACNCKAFMRTIHRFYDDHLYEALGPEYHHAQAEASNANFMFMHCRSAHEILRNANDVGGEFTLERVDQAVLSKTLEAIAVLDRIRSM